MSQIVLKDQSNEDVVFTHVSTAPGQLVFVNRGDNLLDTKQLTLNLNENARVNRVKFKLSVPTVNIDSASGLPGVTYTQVASGDISVVKFSSAADRALLGALTASLVNSTAIQDLVKDGAFPV